MSNTDGKQLSISIPDDNNELIFNDALKFLKRKSQNITIRMSTIHLLIKYIMEYIEKTPLKVLNKEKCHYVYYVL